MEKQKNRYHLIDGLRGLVIISMILFHTVWDLVYLFEHNWSWYQGFWGEIWQVSIGISFVLISGFCVSIGKNALKRGGIIFLFGGVVSLFTLVFMPETRILFGILTFLGLAMIFFFFVQKGLKHIAPMPGIVGSIGLFLLCYPLANGYLGIGAQRLYNIPLGLYRNFITAALGFPYAGFFSADYYPVFPWIFMFLCGYFLYRIFEKQKFMRFLSIKMPYFLTKAGKHSLAIYLVHQPIIYGVLFLFHLILHT